MSFRDPNPQTKPGSNSDDPVTFPINSRIMLTAIIIILFVVILMVTLHLYSRWYLFRSRRFNLRRSRRAAAFIFFSDPSSTSTTVTTRGLEPSVIKTLPIFTFTASNANANANAENAIECAVCLSEFEENESGRVLPNCKHTFHVDCIDMWFHSHSTCPLCRSPVIPIAGDLKPTVEEVAITISELRSDPEAGTSEGSRRKPAAIEIPVRNIGESEENDLSRSQSFRSPMSRVMSFTRILSRERRNPSSSSVGLPPVVSLPVTELDMELGGGRREELVDLGVNV